MCLLNVGVFTREDRHTDDMKNKQAGIAHEELKTDRKAWIFGGGEYHIYIYISYIYVIYIYIYIYISYIYIYIYIYISYIPYIYMIYIYICLTQTRIHITFNPLALDYADTNAPGEVFGKALQGERHVYTTPIEIVCQP